MDSLRKLIVEIQDERETVQLWSHDIDGVSEYELVINGVFIMATYNALSSELLVRIPVIQSSKPDLKILIGGLGLGFSVKEACLSDSVRAIHVVELSKHIIDINRSALRALNGKYLEDRRVRVIHDDFVHYIEHTEIQYDIICMDIDNGPMLLVKESNGEAYQPDFFRKIRRVLNSDGVYVIWSCNRDDALLGDLKRVFLDCRVNDIFEQHQGKDIPYYLYVSSGE